MPRTSYTHGYNVRLTAAQAEAVERHADRRQITASAALREILDEGLEHVTGTPDHGLDFRELDDTARQAVADRSIIVPTEGDHRP